MAPPYRDRRDAGRRLAALLAPYADNPGVLVLALPRGGVPVAFEVARALQAPLDVCLVRKLGVPGQEELALGAIASGGVRVLNDDVLRILALPAATVDAITAREGAELARRERAYREGRPAATVRGRTIILVDDGLATGATMRAATLALRRQDPAHLIAAVPVGAPAVCAALASDLDAIVCAVQPEPFYAVGAWYATFEQTTDEEVRDLLAQAAREWPPDPRRDSAATP